MTWRIYTYTLGVNEAAFSQAAVISPKNEARPSQSGPRSVLVDPTVFDMRARHERERAELTPHIA